MDQEKQVKILLVDDRKEDLLSLEVILSHENYLPVKANSGREALKILLHEQDFALILMDVQMPLMDGFETAELIRQSAKLRHVPIIFLTANMNAPDQIFKGYRKGAVDYILKPFSQEILKAKVSVFVDIYKKNAELISQGEKLMVLNRELGSRSEELIRINEELEKFAFVASHDLQEPLRTIISYIQLLQKKYKEKFTPEADEFMNIIVNASFRMKNIIIDLLEYSLIKSEDPLNAVDCNKAIKEVRENLQTYIKENEVVMEVGVLPTISARYYQIVQLFQNLISNAIKYKSSKKPLLKISAQKTNDGFYLFSFEDNGIGIEQKYEDKIFEIFQRLHTREKYPGTGVGLAICKKIVEKHGGRIWMTSQVGKGTTFFFTIKN